MIRPFLETVWQLFIYFLVFFVKILQHKIHHVKVYYSVAFSIFTKLLNHHHHLIPNHFHHPGKEPRVPLVVSPCPLPSPSPWQLLSAVFMDFWQLSMK